MLFDVLYKTFWNCIGIVTRHDCHHCIGEISNQSEMRLLYVWNAYWRVKMYHTRLRMLLYALYGTFWNLIGIVMRHDCFTITSVTFQTNLKTCILYVLYEYIISRLVNVHYMYVTVRIAQNIFKLRKHSDEARLSWRYWSNFKLIWKPLYRTYYVKGIYITRYSLSGHYQRFKQSVFEHRSFKNSKYYIHNEIWRITRQSYLAPLK